jgi:hypothetical protein
VAELTPIPAAQRPAEPGYQPLSGYAVAAVIVSGVFALALVILVGIGLWSRRTPLSYELLLVPVTGLVLAIIARSHIRNAEGTRTGVKLANASWWICVLGGAGFAAFLAANDLALRRESRRQSDGLVEALRAGKEQEAYEKYVIPPELRGRADPGTPEFEQVYDAFGYQPFLNHPVIFALRANGAAAQVEHVGARDIGQEGDGFKATHKYRITIPEGVFTTQFKMVASEPRAGGKPQWHVEFGRQLGIAYPEWEHMSRYGRLEMETQQDAEKVVGEWLAHLNAHRFGEADLYTRPLAERERGLAELGAAAVLAGGPLLAESVGAPGRPRATVEALLKSGLFRKDATGTPLPDAKIAELQTSWSGISITPVNETRRAAMGMPEGSDRPVLTLTPTGVTVSMPVDVSFGPGMQKVVPASVGLVCTDPALITPLTAAKADGAAARDDGSATLRTIPPRDWRLVWVRSTFEPPPAPTASGKSLGGPGGPSGPPNR